MAFVFATQKYTFEIRYLGVVPLAQITSDTVANEAVELLYHKLESIQQRAVDKAVEAKHGSRLSPASPVWQDIAKKLKKKGNDVTQGDAVKLVVCAEELQLCDPKSEGKFFHLYSRDIEFAKVTASLASHDVVVVVLKAETKYFCHILTCKAKLGTEIRDMIIESKKYGKREHENAVQASAVTKKKVFVKSSHTDSDTLTLGIGLHHKSKLALSATVKAKGYAKMSEKVHEMPELSEAAEDGGDGDDDLLDDLDEDLFSGVDQLSTKDAASRQQSTSSLVSSSASSASTDKVRVDLSNFGFSSGGGDDDDFGFGEGFLED